MDEIDLNDSDGEGIAEVESESHKETSVVNGHGNGEIAEIAERQGSDQMDLEEKGELEHSYFLFLSVIFMRNKPLHRHNILIFFRIAESELPCFNHNHSKNHTTAFPIRRIAQIIPVRLKIP